MTGVQNPVACLSVRFTRYRELFQIRAETREQPGSSTTETAEGKRISSVDVVRGTIPPTEISAGGSGEVTVRLDDPERLSHQCKPANLSLLDSNTVEDSVHVERSCRRAGLLSESAQPEVCLC